MVLGDVLAQHQTDPRPSDLRRVERDEEVLGFSESRPLVLDHDPHAVGAPLPPRIAVADQVDEGLLASRSRRA